MADLTNILKDFDVSKWVEYDPDATTPIPARPWESKPGRLNFDQIDAQLAYDVEGRLREWFPNEKITRSGDGFRVGDSNGTSVESSGLWSNFTGKYKDKGGKGLLSLYANIKGVELKDAARELWNGSNIVPFTKQAKPKPKKKTDYLPPSTPMDLMHPSLDNIKRGAESWHEYQDAFSRTLCYVKRVKKSDGGKATYPVTWCADADGKNDAWRYSRAGLKSKSIPIYGLDAVRDIDGAGDILIVEGEKCADAANRLCSGTYSAVSWLGGGSEAGNVNWSIFADHHVVIWPDNDKCGMDAANKIREQLPHAVLVQIDEGRKKGWDVADWIDESDDHDGGALDEFIAAHVVEKDDGAVVPEKPKNMPSLETGMKNMPRSQEEAVKARPPVIIDGLLYQGGKLLIGAPAKAGKSHFTMGLFAALATASEFLQWHSSKKLKVLYIDFELMEFELRERMAKAFNYNVPDNVSRLALRKYADVRSPGALGEVLSHLNVDQFDVVVFDCLYKFNDADEENSNAEMKAVCSWLDGVAGKYKFAAIVIHHFGKGQQSGKSIVDRFRGGSALAGDFDALMAIANHEEEMHFIIESEVRSFKQTSPFVARWDYPHFVLAEDMDATKHRDKGNGKKFPDADLKKKVPVGKERAMFFNQLDVDLKKPTFDGKVRAWNDVFTFKAKNHSGKMENKYYRSDPALDSCSSLLSK